MKLIFLVMYEILNPVVESQIILPASMMARNNEVVIVALVPIGQMFRSAHRGRLNVLRKRCQEKSMRCVFVTGMPTRIRIKSIDRWLTRRAIVNEIQGRKAVVHARCGFAAEIIAELHKKYKQNVRFIFDCRGDEPAEVIGKAGYDVDEPKLWPFKLKKEYEGSVGRECRSVQKANSVIAVSERMKNMLLHRHKIPVQKITVIPCAVSIEKFSKCDRKIARRELGVEQNIVFAYLGSVEWYQRFDLAIRLFKIVRAEHKSAIFLVITRQVERARKILSREGIPGTQMKIIQAPPDEVPLILCAADIGLLLRHRDMINEVASPVKCAEYLASGVPVLLSEGIGDYSTNLPRAGVGWTIGPEEPAEELRKAMNQILEEVIGQSNRLRKACRDYAHDALSWEKAISQLKKTYGL